MANGRQVAEQNFRSFIAWIASKTDDDFRAMTNRSVLSRTEIAAQCNFAKSALDQNPRIKLALRELESTLRLRGVLPSAVRLDTVGAAVTLMRQPTRVRETHEAEYIRRLEHENATLKAEVVELKRALIKFSVLQDALAHAGRLPR
ncbi:hypothetical protein AB595_06110 [Massilia sp. WF1]|nr:hypothetical protein AB595_06110 [Massilia sp. WF1]